MFTETLPYVRPVLPIPPKRYYFVIDNVPHLAELENLQAFLGKVELVVLGHSGDKSRILGMAETHGHALASLFLAERTTFRGKVLFHSGTFKVRCSKSLIINSCFQTLNLKPISRASAMFLLVGLGLGPKKIGRKAFMEAAEEEVARLSQ